MLEMVLGTPFFVVEGKEEMKLLYRIPKTITKKMLGLGTNEPQTGSFQAPCHFSSKSNSLRD